MRIKLLKPHRDLAVGEVVYASDATAQKWIATGKAVSVEPMTVPVAVVWAEGPKAEGPKADAVSHKFSVKKKYLK